MELRNEFRVGVPVDAAWALLTDLERIVPHMPGAQLDGAEGETWRGRVKVKVGPVTAQYQGKVSYLERDASAHRAVLRAEGRDTRGQGNARATVTATLDDAADGTRVTVVTDLSITGRVAQFGRGLISDVSAKLLDEFVQSLEGELAGGGAATGLADGETSPRAAAPRPGAEPINLLGAAGGPLLRRLAPVLLGVVALGVVLVWTCARQA